MAHLQYMPGDPRLVDQLVYELKSNGIFDQFRKECIADVDTRPAYQNLRQRVETSVATFLSRQVWKPDLNKNQLREKLRKHLLEGNYLEQGVERIVDQVVNPKVAAVFIPQVEDLVYNYLGIPRKKAADPETSNGKPEDLLPTDLEAVSPGSVKSNDEVDMDTSESKDEKMDIDDKPKPDIKDDSMTFGSFGKEKEDTRLSGISELTIHDSDSVSIDKNTITIPLPAEIKLENIPAPENSPPNIKDKNIDLEKIDLPKEPNLSTDIPLPDEIPKAETETYFKPLTLQSEDDDDSSDSSIKRNMSPLTPIRNFNNENSCDAQQAFENDSDTKTDDKKEPSSFRFTIESKSSENSSDAVKPEKKEEPANYQFNTPTVNSFNTPLYDDSSNSNNLQIDYESDANSKIADAKATEPDQNSVDSHKKDKKDDKRSSHKSSHRSRDSSRHSSSKDKRSDSKHSSRDSSRHHDKKPVSSKDDKSKSSEKKGEKEKSSDKSDRGDKKDSRESSKHRSSSHKDSKSSSSHRDSKHKSSSTSSSKHSSKDEKKSSSSSSRDKEKEKSSTKSKDSRDKSKDTKSSSRDKDKKGSSSSSSSSKRSDDKENKEKKEKKEADDHYSLSGRGNPNRRSTDRDSNDGSSSSKGSHNPASKTADSKKESKPSSKSGSTSSSDSTSPTDGVEVTTAKSVSQTKPVVRVDTRLENPIMSPPRLPFVPDVTLKKPKFAANMQEARQLVKMRKFMEEEQKRMNQEAALLLEFQANVRPSLSQVYSSIPGPELEFACMPNGLPNTEVVVSEEPVKNDIDTKETENAGNKFSHLPVAKMEQDKHDDEIAKTLIAMHEDVNTETIDELVEAKVEHTDASVLEDLTDQENDLTIVEEISELSEDKTKVVVKTYDDNDATEENDNVNDNKDIKTVQPIELIEIEDLQSPTKKESPVFMHAEETPLHYFCENEKYDAEIERSKFNIFYKKYTEQLTSKMYLVNCDSYEENIIREVAQSLGKIEIVNYYKNGHLKLPKTAKNIVKNVNVSTEINLPTKVLVRPQTPEFSSKSPPIFSPTKSECSFELSSDYDAKLEEMVNKTSRQEIMEIILGGAIDESPCEMPRIDYCMESNIEDNDLKRKHSDIECTESNIEDNDLKRKHSDIEYTESNIEDNALKRKHSDIECTVNNNRPVLTPNKLRKMSGSDQISSTTEETEETSNSKSLQAAPRSKFLGKARRVGLPKPKKSNIQNSPSSDKSVENYEQNSTLPTPNGKIKNTPRSKVQRYDTSDLYKPKLHYLSRRNNIS